MDSGQKKTFFQELKENLIKASTLRFPNFDKQFIIRTDESYDGLGGVLVQKKR